MNKNIFFILACSAYIPAALAINSETTTTFLFEFESAKIDHASQEKLNSLKNEGNITQVIIDGYSDKLGPVIENLQLSQARAESIKQSLVAKKIDPKLISVTGHGGRDAVASLKVV